MGINDFYIITFFFPVLFHRREKITLVWNDINSALLPQMSNEMLQSFKMEHNLVLLIMGNVLRISNLFFSTFVSFNRFS